MLTISMIALVWVFWLIMHTFSGVQLVQSRLHRMLNQNLPVIASRASWDILSVCSWRTQQHKGCPAGRSSIKAVTCKASESMLLGVTDIIALSHMRWIQRSRHQKIDGAQGSMQALRASQQHHPKGGGSAAQLAQQRPQPKLTQCTLHKGTALHSLACDGQPMPAEASSHQNTASQHLATRPSYTLEICSFPSFLFGGRFVTQMGTSTTHLGPSWYCLLQTELHVYRDKQQVSIRSTVLPLLKPLQQQVNPQQLADWGDQGCFVATAPLGSTRAFLPTTPKEPALITRRRRHCQHSQSNKLA